LLSSVGFSQWPAGQRLINLIKKIRSEEKSGDFFPAQGQKGNQTDNGQRSSSQTVYLVDDFLPVFFSSLLSV
jgi:hypothetical protein